VEQERAEVREIPKSKERATKPEKPIVRERAKSKEKSIALERPPRFDIRAFREDNEGRANNPALRFVERRRGWDTRE